MIARKVGCWHGCVLNVDLDDNSNKSVQKEDADQDFTPVVSINSPNTYLAN